MKRRVTYCSVRALAVAAGALLAWTTVQADTLQLLWWDAWPDEIEVYSQDRSELLGSGSGSFVVDGSSVSINGARIRAVDSSGGFTYLSMPVDGYYSDTATAISIPRTWYADVSAYADGSPEYSFVIEIGNWDEDIGTWTGVAMSDALSYSNLGEHLITWNSGDYVTPQGVTVWAPTAYAVPEPSSAFLLVLGAALMGLRRRVRE